MSRSGPSLSGVWTVRLALGLVAIVAVLAVAGPALAPYDPLAQDTALALHGSSPAHLLGTDYLGRDVLSRLLAGAPASLLSALAAALIGLLVGALPGALSAFLPRPAEWLALRVVDALLALPFILFAIVFAALLGNGLVQATTAIGLLIAPGFFRISRAAIRSGSKRSSRAAMRSRITASGTGIRSRCRGPPRCGARSRPRSRR